MPQFNPFKVLWPTKGLVESTPNTMQPAGSTVDCLNVRNWDSLDQRLRGGKRSGILAQSSAAISAGNRVQFIRPITTVASGNVRETRLIAVANGDVQRSGTDLETFTNVTSGSGALSTSQAFIMGASSLQRLFFADGVFANYQYLNYATNTMVDWEAALTAGTLPRGTTDNTVGATICVSYRGRIVLSGLEDDPQNWFMSKVFDPLDWDYSPGTPTAVQAVAGNNADAGYVGDIITGLFPFQDDYMIMGGANSIWVMAGDPAAGGRIDNIVRGIGIAGPRAGCYDPYGNFYFFADNGLYRMPPGPGYPQPVSQARLDKSFRNIDLSSNDVQLSYDPLWQGVHIAVVPKGSQPATAPVHFWWDERTDSFWKDQYPLDIGPTNATYLASDDPEASGLIFGGWDGFLYRFDTDTTGDDGSAINTFVQFGPIAAGDVLRSTAIRELLLVTDEDGGSVTLDIYGGSTEEEANANALAATAPRFRRVARAGRNGRFRPPVADGALVVRLSQNVSDSTWAYEAMTGAASIFSPMRQKGY